MGRQAGSYAVAVELQSGEGETSSASAPACLQQAVMDFSSGPWRVSRSTLVSSADADMGTPGGEKEGGRAKVPSSLP